MMKKKTIEETEKKRKNEGKEIDCERGKIKNKKNCTVKKTREEIK